MTTIAGNLKICMIEPAKAPDVGSIGANFVVGAARRAGFNVEVISRDSSISDYDVELVSVHHPSDYARLATMRRHGRIRAIGGHITYNNPRPVIPFADYICMGDGETWVVEFLSAIRDCIDPISVKGTLCCNDHVTGAPLPPCRYEKVLLNPPYLNRAGTLSAAWYIEIARGCPFCCHYCELGNSMPYRFVPVDKVIEQIDALSLEKSKKIVLFAPDEASHPDYNRLIQHAGRRGIRQRFGSYRIDQLLRTNGADVQKNQLIRTGVDGMTEATRFKVNKKITDKHIFEYFRMMVGKGHVNFKIFQMFAHPWEELSDFDEWERLMDKIIRIQGPKNVSLRIKWTPLIPQPITQLAKCIPMYNTIMVHKIKKWHKMVARPNRQPGWHIELDGIMSENSHARQIKEAVGCEGFML